MRKIIIAANSTYNFNWGKTIQKSENIIKDIKKDIKTTEGEVGDDADDEEYIKLKLKSYQAELTTTTINIQYVVLLDKLCSELRSELLRLVEASLKHYPIKST